MKKYFTRTLLIASFVFIKTLCFAKYEIVNGGKERDFNEILSGEVVVSYLTGGQIRYTTSNRTIVIVDSTTPKMPMLVYPQNNTVLFSRKLTLGWEQIIDDTAVIYKIEISTSADFVVLKNSFILQTTYFYFELDYAGKYFWRVGCYDMAGNFSGYNTGCFIADLGMVVNSIYGDTLKRKHFSITFPEGSFSEDLQLYFSSSPIVAPLIVDPQKIKNANSKLPRDKVLIDTNIIEFVLRTFDGKVVSEKLNREIELAIPYTDEDNNRIVDNYNLPVATLKIYRLDENLEEWIELPSVVVEPEKMVKTKINHLSVFALIGKRAPVNLDNVYVYPNPYKPDYGINYITFANLTSDAKIKIFNIAGELVDSFDNKNGDTEERWELPKDIASGVYIYLVTDKNGNKKIGKFAIIK